MRREGGGEGGGEGGREGGREGGQREGREGDTGRKGWGGGEREIAREKDGD